MSLMDRITRLEGMIRDPNEFHVISYPWDKNPDIYAKKWLFANRKAAKDKDMVLILTADYSEPKPKWTPLPKEERTEENEEISTVEPKHGIH